MPLVRISLLQGKNPEYKKKVGDSVHQAMVETINCPPLDRFQLFTDHSKENFIYASAYLDIPHTDDLIIIQITLNEGRTMELKKVLYNAIAARLTKSVGVKPQDILINLVEVKKENWSFGNGVAQYAP